MAGDKISKCYSGTESVLTKITLQGYQTTQDKIEQKLLSVKRWQKQTLTDDFKQECIMILQGFDPNSQSESVKRAVQDLQNAPRTVNSKNSVFLKVITVNCGHKQPPLTHTLHSLFENSEHQPDIIVVGLQEVIKLSLITSLFNSSDPSIIPRWIETLQNSMNQVNGKKNIVEPNEQYAFF